jgi:pimeloyl-ACP methyl ester carboxylesterase
VCVQYVADHIPGARCDVFEQGDHWLYIEEAPRFAAAVAAFVAEGNST